MVKSDTDDFDCVCLEQHRDTLADLRLEIKFLTDRRRPTILPRWDSWSRLAPRLLKLKHLSIAFPTFSADPGRRSAQLHALMAILDAMPALSAVKSSTWPFQSRKGRLEKAWEALDRSDVRGQIYLSRMESFAMDFFGANDTYSRSGPGKIEVLAFGLCSPFKPGAFCPNTGVCQPALYFIAERDDDGVHDVRTIKPENLKYESTESSIVDGSLTERTSAQI